MLIKFLFTFFFYQAFSAPIYITFPADIDFEVINSEHFSALYRKGSNELAREALSYAEEVYKLLIPYFPEIPPKTWIVLADFQDSLNGYSIVFPYPHIVIYLSPPSPHSELASFENHLYSVILHEFVHTLHFYPASGFWSILRSIFGSLVQPNAFMPKHYHEGLAVLFETELTNGGRGNNAIYRMYLRKAVEESKWNSDFTALDKLDGTKSKWPGGTSAYFFGYQFYKSFYDNKNSIKTLVKKFSGNIPYYFKKPFLETYGKTNIELWEEAKEKALNKAKNELEEIKNEKMSKLEYFTDSYFHKWGLSLSPDNKNAVFFMSHPEENADMAFFSLKDLKIQKKLETKNPGLGFCWLSNESWITIKSENKKGYYLNKLYWVHNNSETPLTLNDKEIDHIFGLSCDKSKIIAYQDYSYSPTLLRLRFTENSKLKLEKSLSLEKGGFITSLLAEDNLIWFLYRKGLSTTLYKIDSSNVLEPLIQLSGYAFNLKKGQKPGEFYAIWDKDGRYEIWSLDIKRKKAKKIVAVSGGINSFEFFNKEFLVSSYEHGGYNIARAFPIEGKSISLRAISNTLKKNVTKTTFSQPEKYSMLSTIFPKAWIPNILFVPNGAQISAWIMSYDISQKSYFDFFGGYDTRGSPYADLGYVYRINNDFSFTFSPYYFPSYIVSENVFINTWGSKFLLTAKIFEPYIGIGYYFKKLEKSVFNESTISSGILFDISYSFGIKTEPKHDVTILGTKVYATIMGFSKYLGSTDNYYRAFLGIDQYVPSLFTGHRFFGSAKLGLTKGTSLINSYFEGGGELLFSSGPLFLNRGFISGAFLGRSIFNLNLEYRFPLLKVEKGYELYPLFLENIEGAFVADTTTYERDPSKKVLFRNFYTSAGIELKTKLIFSYYLPTLFKIGFYHGFHPLGKPIYVTLSLFSLI